MESQDVVASMDHFKPTFSRAWNKKIVSGTSHISRLVEPLLSFTATYHLSVFSKLARLIETSLTIYPSAQIFVFVIPYGNTRFRLDSIIGRHFLHKKRATWVSKKFMIVVPYHVAKDLPFPSHFLPFLV